MDTGYYSITLLGKKIVSIRKGDNQLYIALLERLNTNTWKKKVLKIILLVFFILKLHRFLYDFSEELYPSNISFKAEEWLEGVRVNLGEPSLKALFLYPPQKDRGRCYAYLFDERIQCIAFAKISLDTPNTNYLRNEYEALTFISESNITFKVPKTICHNFSDRFNYIIYEPMDTNFKNSSQRWDDLPFKFRNQIIGVIAYKILDDCDWWREFVINRSYRFERFYSSLLRDHPETILSGFVHGDLTENNIFLKKEETFIIDWEYSSPSAPYTVDEISFYLMKYQNLIMKNPFDGFRHIIMTLCDGCTRDLLSDRLTNAQFAFAYLITLEHSVAQHITSNWSEKFDEFLNEI